MAIADGVRASSAFTQNAGPRRLAIRRLAAHVPRIAMPPLKRSIALLIRNGDRILSVRRAEDDDELPGVWGLPAGSFRESENLDGLVTRIGREKLGVELQPIRILAHDQQQRASYVLDMALWEAEIVSGSIAHPAWQWAAPAILLPGIAQGSLCCRLAVGALKS